MGQIIREMHTAAVRLETHMIGEEGTFEGYGTVYGVPIDRMFGQVVMERGMFSDSIAKVGAPEIRLLWQHDPDQPIGKYSEVHEDSKGVYVKGQLFINDIPKAKEVYALMKHQAIGGLSVGFGVVEQHTDKNDIVHYTKGELWEISAVTFPANTEATIDRVHSKQDFETIRDLEQFLRDVGLPKKAAVAVANHGFKGLPQGRDASEDVQFLNQILENIRGE